jgi:hypothetical protein
VKKFITQVSRFVLIPIIPCLVLPITYLYYDPFQVVRKYQSFYLPSGPRYITLNNDYVGVETFLNNYPTYNYNSFILGDSRSRFYEVATWSKYIHSDKCFHFDASLESLYGINKKMEFLAERNIHIWNALVILDYYTLLKVNNSEGHLFIKHPLLSGQSMWSFQLEFFKAYCSFTFLHAYLDLMISGNFQEYMKTGVLLDDTPMDYNLKYNEMRLKVFEDLIKMNSSKYYNQRRMAPFHQRDTLQKVAPQVIKDEQIIMLRNVMNIFKTHSTNFKIIISPLYDQVKLNRKDVDALNRIFGPENVYDFSGINSITSDYHNYYEGSHYRPHIAHEIMTAVYQNKGLLATKPNQPH